MEAVLSKIVDLLVEPIKKQLGYLIFYNKNVKNLKNEVAELIKFRDTSLKITLDSAEENGETISSDVKKWSEEVVAANEKAVALKPRCWNLSRYSNSRKAKKMNLNEVKRLQEESKEFQRGNIAYYLAPGWPEPDDSTIATGESNEISFLVKDVLRTLLRDDGSIYMVGIHGVNRDDMKRLVNTIFMEAEEEFKYGVRVNAVEHDKKKIQDEIAYWLGMTKFDPNNEAARRDRLSKRLKDSTKKLILFEDVCGDGLNLEAIGIPVKEGEWNKAFKIILTSSDESICVKMKTQKNYKLVVHKQMLLFGGHSGDLCDDKAHTTIRSMTVAYGNETGICSFQTEYDDNGRSSTSSNHDFVCKSAHDLEEKIELKHPDEFLVSVSGYYISEGNHVVLQSLKFESNKRSFGPYGQESGQRFTSSLEAGKIIGFYGRSSDDSLDAVGYYYEPIPIPIPTDPRQHIMAFGGVGGSSFDDRRHTTIRNIIIESAGVINYIATEYDSNGRSAGWIQHGTNRGGNVHPVELDYPGEFIISVSGYKRDDILTRRSVIGSLTIETNRKKYGPFGSESGDFFSFPSNDNTGKIVGFYGASGWYIDRLGVHIQPFPAQNPTTSTDQIGGYGGTHWDDGAHTTIRKILLKLSNVIVQIEIEYDKNGRSEWYHHEIPCAHSEATLESYRQQVAMMYTGRDAHTTLETIKLDYPGEFLISMSGTTQILTGRVVSSLIFQSNRRSYGPYGNPAGDPFSTSPSTSGKIVGFHGNSDCFYLSAIGAHFESLPISW